jgi:hypothetical protein
MDNWPSLSDVIEAVRQLNPPRNSDRARAKDKLLDRLTSLGAMLPGLDVQRSRNVARLLDMSVILDVSGVKDVARPALFSLLVMETAAVLGLDAEASITRAMVIDEAHEVLGGQTDKRTADLKEGRPSSLLRELRKTGTCGIVATHLPSDLAHGVRGNIGSVIALRQGNRDSIRETAAMLNLAPWQEGELAKLPAHYAIARFSRHGEPVCLEIRDARPLGLGVTPPPSRDEARERSRPVLEAIPFVKRGEPPLAGQEEAGPAAVGKETTHTATANGGLPLREMRVFAHIAQYPWATIDDRRDALGLDRDSEGDARAKLQARGLIAFAGTVGAKNRLFEPTARGREFAQIKGLTIARQQKGSVVHTAVVEYTQRSLGKHSAAFRFQRTGISPTTDGVQPDLLLILSGGGRIVIQSFCRNQPAYEAAALLKLHRLALLGPGDADKVDFILAVAVNKRHREAVERALERENGGKPPDRVVLLDFDTVVDPKFEWASVFEFPL